MRIIENKDIPIDLIVKNLVQTRLDKVKLEQMKISKEKIEKFEENKRRTIEGIKNSLEMSGQINSIIVREKDGKYQLIAGDLRYEAFKIAGKKEISANIIEANDFEAQIISLVENYHRLDLSEIEKENNLYEVWKIGKEEIFGNNKKNMSIWTGIKYDELLNVLKAGEERDKENEKEEKEKSNAIIRASANDLKVTRDLEKIDPNIRKEILEEKVIKNKINQRELRPVVNAIKIASENEAPKEVLKGIVNLVSEKKLNPKNAEDFAKIITGVPKEEQKQLIGIFEKDDKAVDIDRVDNIKNTYVAAPPDIKKKIEDKKIDIKEAEIVSKFPTKEQRDQVLEERKKISEIKDKEKEKELKKHTSIRYNQAEEVIKNGDRKPGNLTKMDIEKELKEFYNSPEQKDQSIIESYQNVLLKTKLFDPITIQNMCSDKGKRTAVEIVWQVYENIYNILVILGEIKVVGKINPRTSPVSPKRLYADSLKPKTDND